MTYHGQSALLHEVRGKHELHAIFIHINVPAIAFVRVLLLELYATECDTPIKVIESIFSNALQDEDVSGTN